MTTIPAILDITSDSQRRFPPGLDRRKRPTSPWGVFRLRRGRRRGPRRAQERAAGYFSDRVSPRALAVGMALVALSTTDAIATLTLIEGGVADEANPAMRYLLGHGVAVFLLGKMAMTLMGVCVLLVCRHHSLIRTRLRVGLLLLGLTGVYALVNVYEAALLLML